MEKVDPIFIDTGAWIARHIAKDNHHQVALTFWRDISKQRPPLVTTNLVIAETATLLSRWIGNNAAYDRVAKIYASSSITVIKSGRDLELRALERMKQYTDQKIGFIDCVSFELMEAERIKRAFSFDHHFAIAGFELVPG